MSNVFRSTDGRYTYFDPRRQAAGGVHREGLERQKMTFDEFVYRAGGAAAKSEERMEGEAEAYQEPKEADNTAVLADHSRYYLYGEPLPAPLQPLLPPPTILSPIPSLSSSLLWVAVDGSVSPLHYDLSDGLLCQLHQSKHMLLLPPRHYHTLTPYPTNHAHDRQSQLHLDTRPTPQPPAEGDEAGREGLECWVGEVQAGEMIYLPYGWWHQVESEGECVSVTYRWDEHQQQLERITAVSLSGHTINRTRITDSAYAASASDVMYDVWLTLLCVTQCERSVSMLPEAAAVRVVSALLASLPEHVSLYHMRRSRWRDEFVRQQLLKDDAAPYTAAVSPVAS